MKTLTIIAIGGALFLTGQYLYRINQSQYDIVIDVSGKVHKVSLDGITLKLNYNIKNPTAVSMGMTPPLIVLKVNGKQIATSNMNKIDIPESIKDSNGRIQINSNEETGNIETEVFIRWANLITIAPALYQRYLDSANTSNKKKPIKIKVSSTCRVYLVGGTSFPYEQESFIEV